jgi:hypothetical protein
MRKILKKDLENIYSLKLKAGRKRYEALPMLFFIMGIAMSFFFSISANIIYEGIKNNLFFKIIYLVTSFIFLILIIRMINKIYVKPIEDIENEIRKISKKLK